MKKATILILALCLLMGTFTAQAKDVSCTQLYRVQKADTLLSIASRYGLTPWAIIKANKHIITAPNYAIYVGEAICLDMPDDFKDKKLSATITQAPAADFTVRAVGKKLVIVTEGFGRKTNWFVKLNNKKIGKIKVTKKAAQVYEIKYQAAPGSLVCIKENTTDLLLCRRVY